MRGCLPIGRPEAARRVAEEVLARHAALGPDAGVVQRPLRGAARYGIARLEAHRRAHAEPHALEELCSGDPQRHRLHGAVHAVNRFL